MNGSGSYGKWEVQIVEEPDVELLQRIVTFQSVEAGWFGTPFELSVTKAQVAFVEDSEHNIVCVASIHDVSENNYWIGNVVVAVNHRRKGWASKVIAALTEHVSRQNGPSTAVLLASPSGRLMYERLGFASIDSVTVSEYDRPALPPPIPSESKPHLPTAQELSGALDLFFRASGMRRDRVLRDIFERDKLCAVLEDNGEIQAAAWGRLTSNYGKENMPCVLLGPIVAKSPDLAITVTAEVLRMEYKYRNGDQSGGLCLRATVLLLDKGWGDIAELAFGALGFAKAFDMPLMAKKITDDVHRGFGLLDFASASSQYCAVAGWDFG